MTTKPETKDQKWQERLREDLVKRLLLEGVEITMSVAKELDEFINVSVGKEIAKAREEGWQGGFRQCKEDMGDVLKPALYNFTAAGDVLSGSVSFDELGDEIIENVEYIEGILNLKE